MLATIRHGQTDCNLKRIFSGSSDNARLTNDALAQAYEVGKDLAKYDFDIAFVSPLTRAKQTFFEINKSLNIPYFTTSFLIERDFKEYEGKPFSTLDRDNFWKIDLENEFPIETISEMTIRLEEFLDYLRREYQDKNILIVAHSGVCKVIKYIVEGKREKDLNNYEMKNLQTYFYKEW